MCLAGTEEAAAGKGEELAGHGSPEPALNRLRERRELLPLEEDILVLAQDSPQRELEAQEAAQLVRAALVQGGLDDLSCGTCAWTTTSGWAARTRCWTLSGARLHHPE